MITLHHFEFSHFNEKARWALDHKRVTYTKRSLLPGFHIPAVWAVSGQRQVPVLVDDGRVIAGSTAILAHLEKTHPEPPLLPAASELRAAALETARWFDDQLGPAIRRAFFFDLLPDRDGAVHLITSGRQDVGARLFGAVFPVTRRLMRAAMKITPEGAAEGRRITEEAFERVARESAATGYLVGDRFSVADLTAAALLAPAVMPPEFGGRIAEPFPPALRAWNQRWRAHPGGAWVAEIYRRHR